MDEPASERITTAELVDTLMTTLANARLEGEPYKSQAEEQLGPIEVILARIVLDRHDVETALKREQTALEQLASRTETLFHAHADNVWEKLGCPDYDPIYNILFPSTPLEAGAHRGQAERLSLVADLLNGGIHPKIDRVQAAAIANELRGLAAEYHERLYGLFKHQNRKNALDTFEASVARIGLLELGTLRRALRSMGVDDTRIKSVVLAPLSTRRISIKTPKSE